MDTEASEKPVETIILVHGTFGDAVETIEEPWWRPGSFFCSELDKALDLRRLPARCWKHLELQYSRPMTLMGITLIGPGSPTYPFSWSGENLQSERRIAADSLQRYLSDLENDSRVGRYHLIAHSHGGNVVTRAIRDIKIEPSKCGAVLFLGTPFLNFDDEGKIRNLFRRINWPIVLLLAVISVVATRYGGDIYNLVLDLHLPRFYVLFAIFLFVSSLVVMLVAYYNETWTPIRHVSAANIVFPGDEAIGLLKKCAAVASDPHLLLHELFSDGPAVKVGHRESLVSSISRITLFGRILEAFTMLCFVVFCRPYRPHFRLFFGSKTRSLRKQFLHFQENPLDHDELGVATKLLTFGYALFLPIDIIFGAIDWLIHIALRMSVWLAVRSTANAAFGIDTLGSAFQIGRVAETPEHMTVVMLSSEAQDRALREIGDLYQFRASALRALGASDIMAMVDGVKSALQGTPLLHSHYYKDPYVIEYIAERLGAACVARSG